MDILFKSTPYTGEFIKHNRGKSESAKKLATANSKIALEMWAGVECTVNRVGEEYFDQLERNGHARRSHDLDLFAQLGVSAIRYPVLWERTAPDKLENADWSWADERLGRLRELGIRPIVGFVHHGSGPRYTSLIDPEFAEKLAAYAAAFATQYPWVDHYTPVNEPLTTARFSGLYGHWYPHGRDGLTFARALLHQCRAIALSMQAIRAINPAAQLVQTEDLGKIYSTPLLAYQAEFENERRWVGFDLLCGRLDSSSPIWHYLRYLGIEEAELDWFVQHPCPPDVIGINHYLTSDRFLDDRLEHYPPHLHGGNGRHQYADVEAVRVCAEGAAGPYALMKEAWERYGIAIAITEAHLGCTREEQLRWLYEIWQEATRLCQEGVDVRAVTAWSLLGAYDWNTLLTRAEGHYEPGIFDLRSTNKAGGAHPRPTALARLVSDLASSRQPDHPLLDVPGWWHRPSRLLFPAFSCENQQPKTHWAAARIAMQNPKSVRPLAIVGATGTLGQAFARLCDLRGIPYRLLKRQEMDITDPVSVREVLQELNPWAVVNAAGYVRVDDAEREPDACLRVNTEGPAILATACAERNVPLLTFSSDLVFDGLGSIPYVESDAVAPLNVYGRSKALAEERVLKAHPNALTIRTSAFFGPWDEYNFVTIALRCLSAGQTFTAAEDAIVSPTYVPDLVNTSLDLLIDGECGLWHLANNSAIAWSDLAILAAKKAGITTGYVAALPMRELNLAAVRPSYSVLGSDRGVLLPCLDRALSRYLYERQYF